VDNISPISWPKFESKLKFDILIIDAIIILGGFDEPLLIPAGSAGPLVNLRRFLVFQHSTQVPERPAPAPRTVTEKLIDEVVEDHDELTFIRAWAQQEPHAP
jgi:hypothetical protein